MHGSELLRFQTPLRLAGSLDSLFARELKKAGELDTLHSGK
jgi:hypothetical protein